MSNTDFIFLYKNEEQAAGEHYFGLLRYWLRSIEKNAPWVHCLYFVTAREIPSWLNTSGEKLKVVCYEDFMPEGCTPTENLNAVSLNLHRIEGLEEQFVVFESPSLFLRRVPEKKVFRNGVPVDTAILDVPSATFGNDVEPHVIMNNAGVINEHFDKKTVMKRFKSLFYSRKYGVDVKNNKILKSKELFPGFAIFPIPYAMLKSVYERVWATEHRLLEACSQQPKANKRDYDYHLIRAWNICEGRFRPLDTKRYCIAELGKDDIGAICSVIRRRKFSILGFLDGADDQEVKELQGELEKALTKLFPTVSAYEKEVPEGTPEIIPAREKPETETAAEEQPVACEEPEDRFEVDDNDFYELNDIIGEDMGTRERAEQIEKMRVGNRKKRRVKRKLNI